MNLKSQLKEVISEITPEKTTVPEVDVFLKKINTELNRRGIKAKAVLGGSFAKNTWLKGDYDVDIFVKFDLKYKGENLSDILELALSRFKRERIHGSRDYFWVRNGIKFEIVPVLDIKKAKDAMNVTDFSPLHVSWVNKNGKSLKDDIRLAKKFCKAQGVYGAESYIRGFSGHVLDILVIYYNGFIPLLKAASKWRAKQTVDYYNTYKGKAELIMNKSKIQSPLILVDPVQPDRNAAAALSDEKFESFVKAAKRFVKNPGKSFSVEKKIDLEKLARKENLAVVNAASLEGKEDVVGTKLLKAFEFLKEKLSEFGVRNSGWEWDKKKEAMFWFVLAKNKLPAKMLWEGPPADMLNNVNIFKRKYKKTFVRNGRVFAEVKRKLTTPKEILKEAFKDNYLKEKAKSLKVVK